MIARNNLEKEEELILQRLVKNLYCQSCLKATQDGTNPRRLSVDRIKDLLHLARDAGDPTDEHVYDIYEQEASKGRTKSEEEEFLAPNMYSHPRKDRGKQRARPPLENLFINNGIVSVAA